MSDPVATLTVDGDPDEWLPCSVCGDEPDHMQRTTVRIDYLPIIWVGWRTRPLREGDRVWLAHYSDFGDYPIEFATATVAKRWCVACGRVHRINNNRWYVTLTDVEAL